MICLGEYHGTGDRCEPCIEARRQREEQAQATVRVQETLLGILGLVLMTTFLGLVAGVAYSAWVAAQRAGPAMTSALADMRQWLGPILKIAPTTVIGWLVVSAAAFLAVHLTVRFLSRVLGTLALGAAYVGSLEVLAMVLEIDRDVPATGTLAVWVYQVCSIIVTGGVLGGICGVWMSRIVPNAVDTGGKLGMLFAAILVAATSLLKAG